MVKSLPWACCPPELPPMDLMKFWIMLLASVPTCAELAALLDHQIVVKDED